MQAHEDAGYGDDLDWHFWTRGAVAPTSASARPQYDAIGARALELWNAAKRLCGINGSPKSIETTRRAFRHCCDAIEKNCPESKSYEDWLNGLATFCETKRVADISKWGYFNRGQLVIREAARARGIYIEAPPNPYNRTPKSLAVIDAETEIKLIKAARKDAFEIYKNFLEPPTHLADVIAYGREQARQYGGLLPLMKHGDPVGYGIEKNIRKHSLPYESFARLIYGTAESLLPFNILITHQLAANVDSVANMRADCMTAYESPIFGLQQEVKLEKARAGEIAPYTVADDRTLSVPWLIRAVCAMTEPLRPFASEEFQNALFLVPAARARTIRALNGSLLNDAFRRYIRKWFPGRNDIFLRSLRKTRAIEVLERTGDPFQVQRLLQQQTLDPRYITDAISRNAATVLICDVQSSMRAAADTEPSRSDGSVDAVSLGMTCRDSRNPPDSPVDERGFCVNYLYPLNDEGFVFFLEPRQVAFFLRDYDELCEAEERLPISRFEHAGYAARKRLMQTYLPKINRDLEAAARALIPSLPKALRIT